MAAAIFPSRRMGAPTQRAPKVASSSSSAYPRSLIFSNSFRNRDKRVIVCGVSRSNWRDDKTCSFSVVGKKSRERFAHRGTVKRTPGACVCDHAKWVGTLHYIQIKNVLPVQDSQVHGFTRYLPQLVQQRTAYSAKRGLIGNARAQPYEFGTDHVCAIIVAV